MNKTSTIVIIVILAIIIIGGVIYYENNTQTVSPTQTATETKEGDVNSSQSPNNQVGPPMVNGDLKFSTTDTTVVLVGSVNPNGGFTSYWYEYGKTNNLGNATPSQMIGSGFIELATPAYITNLSKETTYYFRLVAENQYGKVASNQYFFKTTTGVPSPIGSIPVTKTLPADEISRTTANLNGEITANEVPTEYWFEYGKTIDLGNTLTPIAIEKGNSKLLVSKQLQNLDPATTYYFRINAQNQFGTVNGKIVSFKTLGPVATEMLPVVMTKNATNLATSSVTFNGSVNPGGLETQYWFEYSTKSLLDLNSNNKTTEVTISPSSNTYNVKENISNLNPNTTYYFRLVAKNSLGTIKGDKLSFKTKNK